jgi:CheY-like chemotaxis protein
LKSQSGVIVLVEDRALIRMMICEALANESFAVNGAVNADEAIGIFAARAINIRALFNDIHMPKSMDGLALAHHANRNWPCVGLLITSGRGHPGPRMMPSSSHCLPKPYAPQAAACHLKKMIGPDLGIN